MEYYRREKKFDYLPNSELEVIKGYDVPTSEIKEIEEDFIKNEEVKSLQEAIKNLDVKYQVVIDLYYFEQKSYEEISEITNIKLGTVKSRLSRAKKKIQRIMEQNPN
jgi:RNA polymerase sigma-70 factor (ECF subfamily)